MKCVEVCFKEISKKTILMILMALSSLFSQLSCPIAGLLALRSFVESPGSNQQPCLWKWLICWYTHNSRVSSSSIMFNHVKLNKCLWGKCWLRPRFGGSTCSFNIAKSWRDLLAEDFVASVTAGINGWNPSGSELLLHTLQWWFPVRQLAFERQLVFEPWNYHKKGES